MMPGVFLLALFIPVGTFCGAIPSLANLWLRNSFCFFLLDDCSFRAGLAV